MKKPSLVNRRYLRVKAFQALYGFYRTEDADIVKIERELFESVNELYNLYLYLIKLLTDTHGVVSEILEQNKKKQLPTEEDLNPNLRFLQNTVFDILIKNVHLTHMLDKGKISWSDEHDDLRRSYKQFRESDAYRLYMAREDGSPQIDRDVIELFFKEYLAVNDVYHSSLEEKNIFWQDDLPFAAMGVIKTIQALPNEYDENTRLLADLYKTKDDDQKFVKELIHKTISFNDDYEKLIAAKAKNWETDRIALLDMLLMKMALCELEHFPTIPVKVTLNEYIELAKMYSTPKSKHFINGVLDKLVSEFKESKRIDKRGRGLVE